jgi:SAM-dependent methyltransferase
MSQIVDSVKSIPPGNSEWFRQWFGSRYYDLLYSHRNEEEAEQFISRLTALLQLPAQADVLDLACGKGRHSIYLHSLGYQVKGIDLSEKSIAFAKQFEADHLSFEIADMRFFELNKSFDSIVNLFTSFGYFNDIDDNLLVLQRVKKHLKPGGLFVLDYFNSELVEKNAHQSYTTTKEGIEFHITKGIEGDFVVKHITVVDELHTLEFEERVQLLKVEQLKTMIQTAGLTPIETYGNYSLGTFIPGESERLIIIARN